MNKVRLPRTAAIAVSRKVVLPLAFLTWLYVRRHDSFALARNTIVLAAVLTVATYFVLAPKAVYAISSAESIPSSALATMPALHSLSRSRWPSSA